MIFSVGLIIATSARDSIDCRLCHAYLCSVSQMCIPRCQKKINRLQESLAQAKTNSFCVFLLLRFFFFSILLLSLSIARSATNINNEIQIVCDQAQFVIKPANPYSYNHTVKSFYFDYYSSSHLLCKWLSSLSPYSLPHSLDRSFALSLRKLFCT